MLNQHIGKSLTCIAAGLILFLGGCDDSSSPEARGSGATETVPVYFVDGHGLTAVYKNFGGSDITTELFDLIKEGPGNRQELRTFVPESAELIATTETESDESLRLELSGAFWELPQGERFAAAAQITSTYASLEEGKRLFLLDGPVPGELQDGNGELLEQPLTTNSFGDLAPWIQVQQPVAGATVRHSFPLVALLQAGSTGTVDVLHDGEHAAPPVPLKETTVINLQPALRGEITLQITVKDETGASHVTEIPLEVAG